MLHLLLTSESQEVINSSLNIASILELSIKFAYYFLFYVMITRLL